MGHQKKEKPRVRVLQVAVLVVLGVLAIVVSADAFQRMRGVEPVTNGMKPTGVEDLSALRDDFNRTPGPRMLVFFTA